MRLCWIGEMFGTTRSVSSHCYLHHLPWTVGSKPRSPPNRAGCACLCAVCGFAAYTDHQPCILEELFSSHPMGDTDCSKISLILGTISLTTQAIISRYFYSSISPASSLPIWAGSAGSWTFLLPFRPSGESHLECHFRMIWTSSLSYSHHFDDFLRLHSLHSIWQLSSTVFPPSIQGVMWSASISFSLNLLLHIKHSPDCLS